MKKRILSMLLAVIMVLGLLPVTAFASATLSVLVGGVQMYSAGGTTYYVNGATAAVTTEPANWNAKFDAANSILTVKNLSVVGTSTSNAGIYVEGINVTLTLDGASSVTGADNTGGNSYGIRVNYADLTISGSGTLSVTGGTASNDSYGVSCSGKLTVSGGAISATGGAGTEGSRGLFGKSGIEISGGTVNATGSSSKYCRGIEIGSGNILEVTGGLLVVTGGNGTEESYGISADEGVEAKGGVLVARAHGSGTLQAIKGSLSHTDTKVVGGTASGNGVAVVPNTWADGSSLTLSGSALTLDKDYYIVSTDAAALTLTNDITVATNGKTLMVVSLFTGNTRTYGIEGSDYKLSVDGSGSVIAVGGITNDHGLASLGMGLNTLETTEGSAPFVTAIGGMAYAPRISSSAYSYGLSAATYTLRGGYLTAIGGLSWLDSKGISCNLQNSKVIGVSGATVNAIGGAVVNDDGDSYGISGKTNISAGTVNAVAANAPGGSYGIISGGVSVNISGGTVNATGGKYGLYLPSGTIRNGNFTGGTAAVYSYYCVNARLANSYGYFVGDTLLAPADTDTTVGSANQTVTVKKLPHSHDMSVSCGNSAPLTYTAWDGTGSIAYDETTKTANVYLSEDVTLSNNLGIVAGYT